MHYSIFLFFSIVSYFFSFLSVYHTESFILFIAFFSTFLILSCSSFTLISFSKDSFKYNEIIKYYYILKMWYRLQVREQEIKMFYLCIFVNNLMNYQIQFIERQFQLGKLEHREKMVVATVTLRRLYALRQYTKTAHYSLSGLRSLPVSI